MTDHESEWIVTPEKLKTGDYHTLSDIAAILDDT